MELCQKFEDSLKKFSAEVEIYKIDASFSSKSGLEKIDLGGWKLKPMLGLFFGIFCDYTIKLRFSRKAVCVEYILTKKFLQTHPPITT
jgi:hypothetical protein